MLTELVFREDANENGAARSDTESSLRSKRGSIVKRQTWAGLLLVLIIVTLPRQAEADGEIVGTIPQSGGVAAVVWSGGSVSQVATVAELKGCVLRSLWVAVDGALRGHTVGAPGFVNASFEERFPAGVLPSGTILILICDAGVVLPAPDAPATEPVPFVFEFEEGVLSEDRDSATSTVEAGHAFFSRAFGRTIYGQVTVVVTPAASPTSHTAGQANDHQIATSATGANAPDLLPNAFEKTLVHELFHVLQGELGWDRAVWLFEGAAEYVGYAYLIDQGIIPRSHVLACEKLIANSGTRPLLRTLQTYDDWVPAGSTAGVYGMGFMAVDMLVNGDLSRLRMFFETTDPAGGFEEAFGLTEDQFYADFESVRGSWSTETGACY